MKRIGLVLAAILLTLFSLTACVSDEERRQGNADVRRGRELITDYVQEVYGKEAKAYDFKACYVLRRYDSVVPNFDKIASGYVKATVSVSNRVFDMIYHVNTREVLTKENIPAIQDEFLAYVNETLPPANFVDCKMRLYNRNIEDTYIEEFIKPDILTYKELIETGEYMLELTFRSTASDFDSITEQQWKKAIYPFNGVRSGSQVHMLFVNYKDENGYKLEENTGYYLYIEDLTDYYERESSRKSIDDMVYINYDGDFQVLSGN